MPTQTYRTTSALAPVAPYLVIGALTALLAGALGAQTAAPRGPTHYVRYAVGSSASYGILEGDRIRELKGDLFQNPRPTGRTRKLSEVKLLLPLDPARVSKVIGVAGNTTPPAPQPRPVVPHPVWFAKFASGMVGDGSQIESYPESSALTWECELVLVIGKTARHVTVAEAPGYIFGVAIGNDVTELEWYTTKAGTKAPGAMIGKASDTWSGIGRSIVTGVDYSNLRMTVKQNGMLVADGRTSDLINGPAQLIAEVSRYVTLLPGDLIYSGLARRLPGISGRMAPGDAIEMEIEEIGKLSQTVVAAKVEPLRP